MSDFFGTSQRDLMGRQLGDVKARVETHRINLRRHPVIEINPARQIAEEVFRLKKRAEVELLPHDRLTLAFESVACFVIAEIDQSAGVIDTKQDTDFFEEFPNHGNPVAERLLRLVLAAENSFVPPRRKARGTSLAQEANSRLDEPCRRGKRSSRRESASPPAGGSTEFQNSRHRQAEPAPRWKRRGGEP